MQVARKTVLKVGITLSVLVSLMCVGYAMRAEALAWHLWHQFKDKGDSGLDLSHYQVTIEAKPLADYKNASGLTLNNETGTLFTVLNDMNKIVELSLDGQPLREIQVHGAEDLEGITHVEKDYYVVADERNSKLWLLQIKPETQEVSVNDASLLRFGMHESGNKNFEGVSWDSIHNRLIVVKERDPKYVMSVTGLYRADEHVHNQQPKLNQIEVQRLKQYDRALKWSLRDLSSVTYHESSGHMFLLSDESKLLKEFNEAGQTLSSLALWKGFHGLHKNVPQAEGVSIDNQGNVYIVSEPNLFYVFKPQSNPI